MALTLVISYNNQNLFRIDQVEHTLQLG